MGIVNPCSGPGECPIGAIDKGIKALKAAGVALIGYVPTGWGNVPPQKAKAMVEDYFRWYDIDGIFFDEMSNRPGMEEYYRGLASFARSQGASTAVGNPGLPLPTSYSGIFDVNVVSEAPRLVPPSSFASTTSRAPPESVAAIMYSVHALNQAYVRLMMEAFRYVYVTERGAPDRYSALPGYFANLVDMVRKAGPGMAVGAPLVTVVTLGREGPPAEGVAVEVTGADGTTTEGASPFTLRLRPGETYKVAVRPGEAGQFDHWSNGETTQEILLSTEGNIVISAYLGDGGYDHRVSVADRSLRFPD